MKPNCLRQLTACRLLVFLLFPMGWPVAAMQSERPYSTLSSPRVVPYCYLDDDTRDGDWREHFTLSSGVAHPTEITLSSLQSLLCSVCSRAYDPAVNLDLQTSWQDRAPPRPLG